MNTVDSILLSKYILAKAGKMNQPKLQKLLYYVQAWHLAYFDNPLIEDDFQAWMHGPVSRKVWEEFKVASPLFNDISLDGGELAEITMKVESALTQDQLELLNDVLGEYGDKSAYYLECLTHEEDPWRGARGGLRTDESSDKIIPKDVIKDYFKQRLATA